MQQTVHAFDIYIGLTTLVLYNTQPVSSTIIVVIIIIIIAPLTIVSEDQWGDRVPVYTCQKQAYSQTLHR